MRRAAIQQVTKLYKSSKTSRNIYIDANIIDLNNVSASSYKPEQPTDFLSSVL